MQSPRCDRLNCVQKPLMPYNLVYSELMPNLEFHNQQTIQPSILSEFTIGHNRIRMEENHQIFSLDLD